MSCLGGNRQGLNRRLPWQNYRVRQSIVKGKDSLSYEKRLPLSSANAPAHNSLCFTVLSSKTTQTNSPLYSFNSARLLSTYLTRILETSRCSSAQHGSADSTQRPRRGALYRRGWHTKTLRYDIFAVSVSLLAQLFATTTDIHPDKTVTPRATFEIDAPYPKQAPLARLRAALAPRLQPPPAAKTRRYRMPTRFSPPTLTSKTPSSRTPPIPSPKSSAAPQRNLFPPPLQTIHSHQPTRMPPRATSQMCPQK